MQLTTFNSCRPKFYSGDRSMKRSACAVRSCAPINTGLLTVLYEHVGTIEPNIAENRRDSRNPHMDAIICLSAVGSVGTTTYYLIRVLWHLESHLPFLWQSYNVYAVKQ